MGDRTKRIASDLSLFGKRAASKTQAWISLEDFWRIHPLLYFGLMALIGTITALNFCWQYLFIILPILLLPVQRKWRYIGWALFIFFLIWAKKSAIPEIENGPARGSFQIQSIYSSSAPFQKTTSFLGKFTYLETDQGIFHNIPCFLRTKKGSTLPLANRDYLVSGALTKNPNGNYVFTVDSKSFIPLQGSYSFAEIRFALKEKLSSHISKRIHDKESASLLSALLTGNIQNIHLKFFFQKLGLQHILAISGFHFALVSVFLNGMLKHLFPKKIVILALLTLCSGYCFLIGPMPSVLRAWITISLYLLAKLLKRPVSAFNLIGIALLIEIFYSPAIIANLGFQLTFLATFGILTLYRTCSTYLQKLVLPRNELALSLMSYKTKLSYLFLLFLRKGLALNIAVHLFTVPLLLFTFHKFPLASFLYNLFFPTWIALAFFLLLLSLVLTPIPYLAPCLDTLTSYVTKGVIHAAYLSPRALHSCLHVQNTSLLLTTIFMIVLFFSALSLYQNRHNHFLICRN